MAVTFTSTLLYENITGCQKIMYWQLVASGTYVTGGVAFPSFGLDQIDFIDTMVDGSGANTNGVALVLPNLNTSKFKFYATGASDQAAFDQIANATTVTGFTFRVQVCGVC